ncbi:hypothetical protein GGR57DRAFT_169948 [Xylariaceae sp. FL1272]|nr:hypothetical protein GGR57DRAFT_169948 [Xylariaceae sp. FL1272]
MTSQTTDISFSTLARYLPDHANMHSDPSSFHDNIQPKQAPASWLLLCRQKPGTGTVVKKPLVNCARTRRCREINHLGTQPVYASHSTTISPKIISPSTNLTLSSTRVHTFFLSRPPPALRTSTTTSARSSARDWAAGSPRWTSRGTLEVPRIGLSLVHLEIIARYQFHALWREQLLSPTIDARGSSRAAFAEHHNSDWERGPIHLSDHIEPGAPHPFISLK